MRQSGFDTPVNNPRAYQVVESLNQFIDVFARQAPDDHLIDVIYDKEILNGTRIGQSPERFIEDQLVRNLISNLGYTYLPRPQGINGLGRLIPDFTVTNSEITVIGELKKPNKIQEGVPESVDYIEKAEERPVVGIATDGLTWVMYVLDENNNLRVEAHEPLRSVLQDIHRNRSPNKESEKDHTALRDSCYSFVESFEIEATQQISNS